MEPGPVPVGGGGVGVATGVTGPAVGVGTGVVLPPATQKRITGISGSEPLPTFVFHDSFTKEGAPTMYETSPPPWVAQIERAEHPRPLATLTMVSMRPPVHTTNDEPPTVEMVPTSVPPVGIGEAVGTAVGTEVGTEVGTGVEVAVPGTR